MREPGDLPPKNSSQLNEQLDNDELVVRDWRNSSQPRNPEDDLIVDGWKRKADGTYERTED